MFSGTTKRQAKTFWHDTAKKLLQKRWYREYFLTNLCRKVITTAGYGEKILA